MCCGCLRFPDPTSKVNVEVEFLGESSYLSLGMLHSMPFIS